MNKKSVPEGICGHVGSPHLLNNLYKLLKLNDNNKEKRYFKRVVSFGKKNSFTKTILYIYFD